MYVQGPNSDPLSNEDVELVFQIFHDVDAAMSEWRTDSPLSKVNAAAGDHPVQVPSDGFVAVERAI